MDAQAEFIKDKVDVSSDQLDLSELLYANKTKDVATLSEDIETKKAENVILDRIEGINEFNLHLFDGKNHDQEIEDSREIVLEKLRILKGDTGSVEQFIDAIKVYKQSLNDRDAMRSDLVVDEKKYEVAEREGVSKKQTIVTEVLQKSVDSSLATLTKTKTKGKGKAKAKAKPEAVLEAEAEKPKLKFKPKLKAKAKVSKTTVEQAGSGFDYLADLIFVRDNSDMVEFALDKVLDIINDAKEDYTNPDRREIFKNRFSTDEFKNQHLVVLNDPEQRVKIISQLV